MHIRILLVTLFAMAPLFAQQKGLRFLDAENHRPVADADVYTDSVFVAATNYNGNVKVDFGSNYQNLLIDHVGYQKRIIPRDSLSIKQVYTLKKRVDMLDEVVVDKERLKDSLAAYHLNFSHGIKAARFITGPDNSYVTKIKFRVINTQGVKGLNFLPFKANVYDLDSITKLPGKPLLAQDVLVENKTGADWAVVDISAYKLKLPPQGACLVFIIPEWDDGFYTTRTISSRVGEIDAVPYLKSELTWKLDRSYLYTQFVSDISNGKWSGQKWRQLDHRRYMIEAEFASAN